MIFVDSQLKNERTLISQGVGISLTLTQRDRKLGLETTDGFKLQKNFSVLSTFLCKFLKSQFFEKKQVVTHFFYWVLASNAIRFLER